MCIPDQLGRLRVQGFRRVRVHYEEEITQHNMSVLREVPLQDFRVQGLGFRV
jgi:hypothetical protein